MLQVANNQTIDRRDKPATREDLGPNDDELAALTALTAVAIVYRYCMKALCHDIFLFNRIFDLEVLLKILLSLVSHDQHVLFFSV